MSDGHSVIVCQGLPVCALTGDAAIAEQKLGCPWCQRIHYDEFGNREVVEPYTDRGRLRDQGIKERG